MIAEDVPIGGIVRLHGTLFVIHDIVPNKISCSICDLLGKNFCQYVACARKERFDNQSVHFKTLESIIL
jgi:hypothetical protein